MAKLVGVEDVDIEAGVFKYVLIKVIDNSSGESKLIVRGYAFAEYHDDIYQHVRPVIEALGLETDVLGGGRIKYTKDEEILVYGYSVAFGQADHSRAVALLKKAYPEVPKVHFSNEGY
eukprot:m.4456 g.4456  ORF g.4456 m.4456 type:complete len:118 (-) comp6965_c0_seq1:1219-1572(-)